MINIAFYQRCIAALQRINEHTEDEPMYDIYRSICIKKFEIILDQSGELLKKYLVPYFAGRRQVDQLIFNDIFRYAGKHRLLSLEQVERWLRYRKNRNITAHDYGEGFAQTTLTLLPTFVEDPKYLESIIIDYSSKQDI